MIFLFSMGRVAYLCIAHHDTGQPLEDRQVARLKGSNGGGVRSI